MILKQLFTFTKSVYSFPLIILLLVCSFSYAQLSPSFIGDTVQLGDECYQITDDVTAQGGSVFYDNAIDFTSDFEIIFDANFGDNDADGADGLVFVFKTTAIPELGITGGGLGYEGINNSLAIEFDTWQNGERGDPVEDHMALISNGNTDHANTTNNLLGPVNISATSINVEDGNFHEIKISWIADTQALSVFFDCEERLLFFDDLVTNVFGGTSDIFFGFTGSTGGFSNTQTICFKYLSFIENLTLEDQDICADGFVDTVDATYNGASSYSWTPTTGVSDPNSPNPSFTPDTTTEYSVTITDNCGITIVQSFTVTVLDDLTATVDAIGSPVCIGDDAQFIITGTPNTIVTYTINGGANETALIDAGGNTTISVSSITTLQTINLIAISTNNVDTNGNGLSATGGFNPINATGIIDPAATVASGANCARISNSESLLTLTLEDTVPIGTTITISLARNNASGNMIISDGVNTLVYNGGVEDLLEHIPFTTGTTTNTLTFTRTFGQLWIDGVDYTIQANNCSQNISATAAVDIISSEFTITPVCNGATMNPVFDGGTFSFNPLPTDGATINSITGDLSNTTSGTSYTVAYTFTGLCNIITTNTFIGIASPQTVIPSPIQECDIDSDSFSTFNLEDKTAEIINGQPNVLVTYHETLDDAQASQAELTSPYTNTTANSQTIFVRLEDVNSGCFSTTSVELQVIEQPIATLNLTDICPSASDEISITPINFSENEVSIQWFLDTVALPGENNLVLSISETGDYSIELSFNDASACSNFISGSVTDKLNCIIPQGISPDNNDGKNDTFDLSGFNVTHIEIYNRYGAIIFEKDNYKDEWKGQSKNGDKLPVGTYFYTMTYEGGTKNHVGWVYVQR